MTAPYANRAIRSTSESVTSVNIVYLPRPQSVLLECRLYDNLRGLRNLFNFPEAAEPASFTNGSDKKAECPLFLFFFPFFSQDRAHAGRKKRDTGWYPFRKDRHRDLTAAAPIFRSRRRRCYRLYRGNGAGQGLDLEGRIMDAPGRVRRSAAGVIAGLVFG